MCAQDTGKQDLKYGTKLRFSMTFRMVTQQAFIVRH